jgi:hypothetical protein
MVDGTGTKKDLLGCGKLKSHFFAIFEINSVFLPSSRLKFKPASNAKLTF